MAVRQLESADCCPFVAVKLHEPPADGGMTDYETLAIVGCQPYRTVEDADELAERIANDPDALDRELKKMSRILDRLACFP